VFREVRIELAVGVASLPDAPHRDDESENGAREIRVQRQSVAISFLRRPGLAPRETDVAEHLVKIRVVGADLYRTAYQGLGVVELAVLEVHERQLFLRFDVIRVDLQRPGEVGLRFCELSIIR